MARPQFGDPHPSLTYRDRPAAFGVLERDGLVALVAVEKPGIGPGSTCRAARWTPARTLRRR
jgi:hypothetical protein